MTVTPTKKQIEAEIQTAHFLLIEPERLTCERLAIALATIRLEEREACAKIADGYAREATEERDDRWRRGMSSSGVMAQSRAQGAEEVARRILALKKGGAV